jgi:hypothetical protein
MKRLLIAAIALVGCAGSANAAVQYVFKTGVSDPYPVAFSYILPSFINADRNVSASGFETCSYAVPDMTSCATASFAVTNQPFDIISVLYGTPLYGNIYSFAKGAFTTPGEYTASLYAATLSVSIVPLNVPEPATWAMVLVGFGAIGAAMRRRDRRGSLWSRRF